MLEKPFVLFLNAFIFVGSHDFLSSVDYKIDEADVEAQQDFTSGEYNLIQISRLYLVIVIESQFKWL